MWASRRVAELDVGHRQAGICGMARQGGVGGEDCGRVDDGGEEGGVCVPGVGEADDPSWLAGDRSCWQVALG